MTEKEWQTDKPPHNTLIEVEFENHIIKVKAIWGDRDKGVLPHWEAENGMMWNPDAFTRWRYL